MSFACPSYPGFPDFFIRRSLRIPWILPLQGQESSPALKVTSREPPVPPSAQLEPRRAQRAGWAPSLCHQAIPTRQHRPPKASPGFMAAGMSGLEEAQPSSSWLSWKKGTQEFGRGPRLEQRGPCAEARWEKQPLPCQDKRCSSTPFSAGIEDVVPPTPANLGKVGSSRDAHLAWSF